MTHLEIQADGSMTAVDGDKRVKLTKEQLEQAARAVGLVGPSVGLPATPELPFDARYRAFLNQTGVTPGEWADRYAQGRIQSRDAATLDKYRECARLMGEIAAGAKPPIAPPQSAGEAMMSQPGNPYLVRVG